MFSCLCGDSAYRRIALGTTKWHHIDSGSLRKQDEDRFSQLKEKYWKDLIGFGSETYQIEPGSKESAIQLVCSILEKLELTTEGEEFTLQLQRELVDEGKTVPKTKAGMILEKEGRKYLNRAPAGMTEEEKLMKAQLDEIDRELKKLAIKKNPLLEWAKVSFDVACGQEEN